MTDQEQELVHVCEVCGVTKTMTPEQAFQDGWDYPPRMGEFGVVSPRTCGDHPITDTLYWRLITHKGEEPYHPTDAEIEFVRRVQAEPESITPTPSATRPT